MRVLDVVDDVMGLVVPDDPPGVVGLIKDLITLRNATECKLSAAAAHIERLGIAKKSGSTTSKLLQANGVAPAVASRWLRIGTGLTGLDRTAGYFRDGFLSTEHVDAVVRGRAHVAARAGSEMVAEERADIKRKLLSHAISGASPDEVGKVARKLGNHVSGNAGGLPASEDSAMNTVDFAVVDDHHPGRVLCEMRGTGGMARLPSHCPLARRWPDHPGKRVPVVPHLPPRSSQHGLGRCHGARQTPMAAPAR